MTSRSATTRSRTQSASPGQVPPPAPVTIRDIPTAGRDRGFVVLTLLVSLAGPIITGTMILSRKRAYKPTFRPGGPLPRRQPLAERTSDRVKHITRKPDAPAPTTARQAQPT